MSAGTKAPSRGGPAPRSGLQIGDWRVDPDLDEISSRGQTTKLEPRTMRLLLYLADNRDRVVGQQEILEAIWQNVVVTPQSVYSTIAQLRQALGGSASRSYIATVPRKGYRLTATVSELPSVPAHADLPAGPVASSAPPRKGWLRWTIGGGVAIGICVSWIFVFSNRELRPGATRTQETVASAASAIPRPEPEEVNSIAVLPMVDLSEKQNLGYFADGLAEELIDLLSRNTALRVPARTSSFYFRGKSTPLAEIARQLNVANVLEGSVRQAGRRVRVTAQLIRADNGDHLWSQTYEGQLTDVLRLEDEIAGAVIETLQAKLVAGASTIRNIAANPEAHNLLLECRFYSSRNTPPDARKAVSCFKSLTNTDPDNPDVWLGYAGALYAETIITEDSIMVQRAAARRALQAAQRALQLDPRLAPAHASVGTYLFIVDHDWRAAEREMKTALSLDPNDPASLLAAATLARRLGRLDEFIALCQRAISRDPLNFHAYARLGDVYSYLGRLPEAEAAVRHRLDLSPEGNGGYTQLADVLLALHQPRAALAAAEQEPDSEMRMVGHALVFFAIGRRSDADAALAELIRNYADRFPTEIAEVFAYRRETNLAFESLERAARIGDPQVYNLKSDAYFRPLQTDPRYRSLLRKLNLPD
jgi:TolB-like protein/DNA-binding winged helix-turn-helix (wHTH) protein